MKAIDRRAAILAAALPLFAANGPDGVTTKEIAAAAAVSEALLYRHFPSKQAIFEAIQEDCVREATENIGRLEELPDNTATLVMCIYLLMWKILRGPQRIYGLHTCIARLQLRSLLDDGSFARSFLELSSAAWVDKLSRCVDAAIAAGDLENDREGAELGIWFAHHMSIALRMYGLPSEPVVAYPVDPAAILDHAVLYCLRGLGLTRSAINAHYNPRVFDLLLSGAETR
ncbi:MAG: helix-turn-helix transcriptional regulator [Candidatus Schekmanbacteria bacterium]|nr:helix-turn-helix transcriptional regulator [Candidatus Schekmanbacteria bacterium]